MKSSAHIAAIAGDKARPFKVSSFASRNVFMRCGPDSLRIRKYFCHLDDFRSKRIGGSIIIKKFPGHSSQLFDFLSHRNIPELNVKSWIHTGKFKVVQFANPCPLLRKVR